MQNHCTGKSVAAPIQKTTTAPEGKWIEVGHHHVIPDAHGRILASIFVGIASQMPSPVSAFIDGRKIGEYISAKHARAAVNRVMQGYDDAEGSILKSMIASFQKMREAVA